MKKRLIYIMTAAALLFPQAASAALDTPDAVTDYLCIGSQYTNKAYGNDPNGRVVSLGNFGGYITYYYEEPITDDPKNLYGMELYIIGNSEETNIDSLAEAGQVYVSEDGEKWYALAGSEHYEDSAVWDYTITYSRDEDGSSSWTDNYGNAQDYAAVQWPDPEIYTLNSVGNADSYSFTGVALRSQYGTITGGGTADSYAAKTSFGYVDYYDTSIRNGKLIEADPYVEAPSRANGFDLEWAVDDEGMPVDVSGKEFHYIRVSTASNIYAGGFKEKSTEVSFVVRTAPQENEVGRTDMPASVTVTDRGKDTEIKLTADNKIYDVPASSDCSVTVNSDAENVYINNRRSFSAKGFPKGIARIITQSGDKEPYIVYLRFTGGDEPEPTDAPESTEAPEPTATPQPTEAPEPTSVPSSGGKAVSVSFTLYGDKRHGEKDSHTYKSDKGSLPIWIRTRTIAVSQGSTIFDVLKKALNDAGLEWTASGTNYISEINGLSEFDNGELSGWMYLYNGEHGEVGVADQTVKSGDKIIFHYTDDYTAEQGSEKFTRRSSSVKQEKQKNTDISGDKAYCAGHEKAVGLCGMLLRSMPDFDTAKLTAIVKNAVIVLYK